MNYPITPEYLDAVPSNIVRIYRDLEIKLIEEICCRIALTGKANEVVLNDIRVLRQRGISQDRIDQLIRESLLLSEGELDRIYKDAARRNQQYYQEMITKADILKPDLGVSFARAMETVEIIGRRTKGEFENLTRTTAFQIRVGGRPRLVTPKGAFYRILDDAEVQIRSGAVGYQQAFEEAVKHLADSGVKTVEYAGGHTDQLDVAVRRAVMTGVSQISDTYTQLAAEVLETDHFEISAHIGARDKPGPSPWSSHKAWQGKVYSIRSGDIYPNIYAVCGLGYVDGLEGANCRHRRFCWVEGVSERTYTDQQLETIDPPPFAFEGKTYSIYEATQKQREIERTVRKLKREKAAFQSAGLEENASAVNIRIRRLNKAYKAFSAAAGLPMQKERMKAGFAIDLTDTKAFAPLKEYQGNVSVIGKFSDKQYVVDAGKPVISGATGHFEENLQTRPDRAGLHMEEAQRIINSSKLTLYQPGRETLKFLADSGYAVIGMKGQLVTVVPEKLRKKYRDYLEGK